MGEFKITEADLVNLFIEKCKRYGIEKKGVYNNQDPTRWSKVMVEFEMNQGDHYTTINVEIKDNTWILEIVFSEDNRMGNKKAELASGMWDPQDKKWLPFECAEEAFFDLIKRVFLYGEHKSEMNNMDDLYSMGYGEE
jgi:hypothetical protein